MVELVPELNIVLVEVRPKRVIEIRPEVEFEAFPVSPCELWVLHTTL